MERCYLPPAPAPGTPFAQPNLRYVQKSPVPCAPTYLLIGDSALQYSEIYYAYSIIEAAKNDDWFLVFQQYGVASVNYEGFDQLSANYQNFSDLYQNQIQPYLAENRIVIYLTGNSFPQDGQGTAWCAWHSCDERGYPYAFVPAPIISGCIGNYTYLQRLGILVTHELGEALTHPIPDGEHGWVNENGDAVSETGDGCAWMADALTNTPYYSQKIWSNRNGVCYPQ